MLPSARRNAREGQATVYRDRRRAVGSGAVAEFAVRIVAPAVRVATRRDAARELEAGSDSGECEATLHRGGRSFDGRVRGADAELSIVGPPAVCDALGRQSARVLRADGNARKLQPTQHGAGDIRGTVRRDSEHSATPAVCE